MQTETHFDFVIWHPSVQTGMISILSHLSRAFRLRNNFQETYQGHIAKLRHFVRWNQAQLSRFIVKLLTVLIELPDEQERISDVLVGGTLEAIDDSVNDLTDLVHKEHNALLEHFGCVCEPADVAEAEDTHAFETRQERVYIVTFAHILTDNFRPGLTKADGEQASDLL